MCEFCLEHSHEAPQIVFLWWASSTTMVPHHYHTRITPILFQSVCFSPSEGFAGEFYNFSCHRRLTLDSERPHRRVNLPTATVCKLDRGWCGPGTIRESDSESQSQAAGSSFQTNSMTCRSCPPKRNWFHTHTDEGATRNTVQSNEWNVRRSDDNFNVMQIWQKITKVQQKFLPK